MLRSKLPLARRDRRGIALVIVLAVLGLFAALGLSFSQIAKLEGQGARNYKRAAPIGANAGSADRSRDYMLEALSQLVFDTNNTRSAIRGHSLLRDMFGGVLADGESSTVYNAGDVRTWKRGVYNGTGLFLPYDLPLGAAGGAVDETALLGPNYTLPQVDGQVSSLEVLFFASRLRPNGGQGLGPAAPGFAVNRPTGYGFFSSGASLLGVEGAAPSRLFPVFPFNFTVYDAFGNRGVTPVEGPAGNQSTPEPERYFDPNSNEYHYFGYDEDYDAADLNNMFLALERADGTPILPSFHRPALIRQLEMGGRWDNIPAGGPYQGAFAGGIAAINPAGGNDQVQGTQAYRNTYPAWDGRNPGIAAQDPQNAADREPGQWNGRRVIFRPRRADFNPTAVNGTGGNTWQDPPDVNLNGLKGDTPEELDVDTDGDGIKDSIWVYLGHRPVVRGTGYVLPLYAFKVLDLDGRINLNTAGNVFDTRPATGTGPNDHAATNKQDGHYSNLGATQAEVNPKHLGLINHLNDGTANGLNEYLMTTPAALRNWWMLQYNGGTHLWQEFRQLYTGDVANRVPGKWNPQSGAPTQLHRPGIDSTAISDITYGVAGATPITGPLNYDGLTTMPAFATGQTQSVSAMDWRGLGQSWEPWTAPGAYFSRAMLEGFPGTPSTSYYKTFSTESMNTRIYGLNDFTTNIYQTASNDIPGMPNPANRPIAANAGGLPQSVSGSDLALVNVPEEMNLFGPAVASNPLVSRENGTPADALDSAFSAEELHRLYRTADLDGSTLSTRVERLLPFLLRSDFDPFYRDSSWPAAQQVSDYNSLTALPRESAWSLREYARERVRRSATTESWDLSRFSAVPASPTATTVSASVPVGTPPVSDDAARHVPPNNRHHGYPGVTAGTPPNCSFSTLDPYTNSPRTRLAASLVEGQRFDLNQPLTNYASNGVLADQERTDLAEQLFVLLLLSTKPDTRQTDIELMAQVRVLAQMAVNIVDYTDSDSVMTVMVHPGAAAVRQMLAGNIAGFSWPALSTYAAQVSWPAADGSEMVMGFELPDLVINEAVNVAYDDGTGNDICHQFVELRNPWQVTRQTSGAVEQRRNVGLAAIGAGAERSNFRIRINDSGAGGTPTTVRFRGTDLTPNPAYNPALLWRLDGDDGNSQGHLLVGPADPLPAIGPLVAGWTGQTNNHYTAPGFTYTRPSQTQPTMRIQVDLLRLRNPFDTTVVTAASEGTTSNVSPLNPFVRVDAVVLTGGNGAWKTDTGGGGGPPPGGRLSLQRREPWIGQGELGWNPNPGSVDDMMGNYIGFPAIGTAVPNGAVAVNNRRLFSENPVNGTAHGVTARQRFGFVTDMAASTSLAQFNVGGAVIGRNTTVETESYLSFPFLDRPLATPLELLSLRLYGSSWWTTSALQEVANEWKLRFLDDHEFIVHNDSAAANQAPGIWRSRQVDWFADARLPEGAAPVNGFRPWAGQVGFENQRVIPQLYRFFEFVECHNRFRDSIYVNGTAARRKLRQAGKINLNTVTEEEVFRALFDSQEVMPAQSAGWNLTTQVGDLSIGALRRLPVNYPWNGHRNLFSLEMLFSSNSYLGGSATNWVWGGGPPGGGTPNWSVLTIPQFPGINDNGTFTANAYGLQQSSQNSTVPAGRDPYMLVHSEMYRMFLLSRGGVDTIHGTGDDRPFRSFASGDLRSTIFRKRNRLRAEVPPNAPFDPAGGTEGDYIATRNAGVPVAAGQYTPRLFDPVSDPYTPQLTYNWAATAANARSRHIEINDRAAGGLPSSTGGAVFADRSALGAADPRQQIADYWMLEARRNKLYEKIGNNFTTRSHVFAAWVTVGFFKVEPGTENLQVPLINEEDGIATGTNVRYRGFFLIDRSRADRYTGPQNLTSFEDPAVTNLLLLPERVRIIE